MNENYKLPVVRFKRSLLSDTETLISESVVELANTYPRIWRGNSPHLISAIDMVSLDRIGGEYGFGGSRVFVAAINGEDENGKLVVSVPLLAKIVEGNQHYASKLLEEQARYANIKGLLGEKFHAVPLLIYPSRKESISSRILWSEFLDETIVHGLPSKAPNELRHYLENSSWQEASGCLLATYKILEPAHRAGNFSPITYFSHYKSYLRLDKDWSERLNGAIGNQEYIQVLGSTVRNPMILIGKLQKNPEKTNGMARLSAVHGDLHPRNIIVGQIYRAMLIDFGWSQPTFHTIVDYALMEISLKFFYLPWHVNRKELVDFERQVLNNYLIKLNPSDPCLRGMFSILEIVRQQASNYIEKSDDNWFVVQYLLPLFFATMGTFAFASKVNNLGYLLLSAGLLAERIERGLKI